MRFWRTVWTSLVGTPPHRQDVRDRLAALPELPEAELMRHTRRATRKPKSLAEWSLVHGRKAS